MKEISIISNTPKIFFLNEKITIGLQDKVQGQLENFIVRGTIFNENEEKVDGLVVIAFDKELRKENTLGSDETNSGGEYNICYKNNQLIYADKKSLNILIRVYNKKGVLYGESPIYFNATQHQVIDLKVKLIPDLILSEFDKLIENITPHLDGTQLSNLSDEDIKFLSNSILTDEECLKVLRNCDKFSKDINISLEMIYAIYKENLSLDIEKLIDIDSNVLREKLIDAVNSNYVSKKVEDENEYFISKLNFIKQNKDNEKINNATIYELIGQLLTNDSTPLRMYKVTAFDVSQSGVETSLGYNITNNLGLFLLTYTSASIEGEQENFKIRTFKLVIFNEKDMIVYEKIINFQEGSNEVILVPIEIPKEPELSSPEIDDINTKLQLGISRGFINFLKEKGVNTLEDIRAMGGIENILNEQIENEFKEEEISNYMKLLNSHANLQSVSDNIAFNQKLIENNIHNSFNISNTSRPTFVSMGGSTEISDFSKSAIQIKSKVQNLIFNNITTSILVNKANGQQLEEWQSKVLDNANSIMKYYKKNSAVNIDISPPECNCKDCESVISPLAYLADLIEYALNNIMIEDNKKLKIWQLDSMLFQPFGGIPNSCEVTNKLVKQIRICVEVLRGYLDSKALPVLDSSKYKIFKDSENKYIFQAYKQILVSLGTSYDELRLLRYEENQQIVEQLSQRIEIDVTKNIDIEGVKTRILDLLFLEQLPNNNRLTEKNLENIFGLLDTNRNPFDPEEQCDVISWKLDYLNEIWKQQDWVKDLEVPIIDPNVIDIEDIRSTCGVRDKNVDALLSQRKKFVNDKKELLKSITTNGIIEESKIIEMIGIVNSYIKETLQANGVLNNIPEIKVTSLMDLYYKLKGISDKSKTVQEAAKESKEAKEAILKLNFSLEGFTRLVEILIAKYNKDKKQYDISEEELKDIWNILVYVMKKYTFNKWINQEIDNNIQLSFEQFCISDRKLTKNGKKPWNDDDKWLASETAKEQWKQLLKNNNALPIIEPDLLKDEYFKTPLLSDTAYGLFNNRKQWIADKLKNLKDRKEEKKVANNPIKVFDELLGFTVGVDSRKIEEVYNRKKYGYNIKGTLKEYNLNYEGFNYIYNILKRITKNKTIDEFEDLLQKTKDTGGDIDNVLIGYSNISEKEWQDIYDILLQVLKVRHYYIWRVEEKKEENEIVLSEKYFTLPKEVDNSIDSSQFDIPQWLGEYRDLRNWLSKLEGRIKREDEINDLWKNRVSEVEGNVLPSLREALIIASNAEGDTLEDKSKWLSHLLLIDTQQGSSLTTTRPSQAIETLQSLLTLLHRGELKAYYPTYTVSADSFESDWKWLGTYQSWRSAMFVYSYPENLLLPSNKPMKTFKFEEILNNPNNNRLKTEDVYKEAKKYEEYLRDMSDLEVMATCEVDSLVYMFAIGGFSGELYYSTYSKIIADENQRYSPWNVIILVDNDNNKYNKVIPTIYVQPYIINDDKKYICLFAKLPSNNGNKLFLGKLDLKKLEDLKQFNLNGEDLTKQRSLSISLEGILLELPEVDICDFDFIVKQSEDYKEKPYVIIKTYPNERVYHNRIDKEASNWGEAFKELSFLGNKGGYKFCGLMVLGRFNVLIAQFSDGLKYCTLNTDCILWIDIIGGNEQSLMCVGAFRWNNYYQENIIVNYRISSACECKIIQISTFENIEKYRSEFHAWVNSISGINTTTDDFIVKASYVINNDSPYYGNIVNVEVSIWRLLMQDGKDYDLYEASFENPEVNIEKYAIKEFFSRLDPKSQSFNKNFSDMNDFVIKYTLEHFSIMEIINIFTEGVNPSSKIWVNSAREFFIKSDNYSMPVPLDIKSIFTVSYYEREEYDWITKYIIYSSITDVGNIKHNRLAYLEGNEFPRLMQPLKYISLKYGGPLDIINTDMLTEDKIQIRRAEIQKAFIENDFDVAKPNMIYLEEAYYFLPMYFALQLQRSGDYESALDWFRTVYDYTVEASQRKIYYRLKEEENINSSYERDQTTWLLDPLNAYYIASTRVNSFTRYTIMSIAKCLLDYADSEFVKDTTESVTKARNIYDLVLSLLEAKEVGTDIYECNDGGVKLSIPKEFEKRLSQKLSEIKTATSKIGAIKEINDIFSTNSDLEVAIDKAFQLIDKIKTKENISSNIGEIIESNNMLSSIINTQLLGRDEILKNINTINDYIVHDYGNLVSNVTGIDTESLLNNKIELPWLKINKMPVPLWNGVEIKPNYYPISNRYSISDKFNNKFNLLFPTKSGVENAIKEVAPLNAILDNLGFSLTSRPNFKIPPNWFPKVQYNFCMPINYTIKSLYIYAKQNLRKIRTGRNISGLQRLLEPYSAPTDTVTGIPSISESQIVLQTQNSFLPTPYRYNVLIEKARQLATEASNIESRFLASLEKGEEATYNILKARQDLSLSYAEVSSKQLKVQESIDSFGLSKLQIEKCKFQEEYYNKLIQEGLNSDEQASLDELNDSMENNTVKAIASGAVNGALSGASKGWQGAIVGGILGGFFGGLFGGSDDLKTQSQIHSMNASFARRTEEWNFNKEIASKDVGIATQQQQIALTDCSISQNELYIANLKSYFCEDILNFLHTKKTLTAEMYYWMSNILEGVYRYFLNEATAVAKLAQAQLAFERQEFLPQFIKGNYWKALNKGQEDILVDRRGLTGSVRLLQDISELDQYAFNSAKKKLQVSKTISLLNLDPIGFQQFRETGILRFSTNMEMFNRDFPSHYLRLIKNVNVNVLALVPAIQGIKATLSSTGLSRTIIRMETFREKQVKTTPESIVLSSSNSSIGQYEMKYQQDMLLPFEGLGVDTQWEFKMPKAANLMDYNSIADILFTIEYTALSDEEYGSKVIKELGTDVSLRRVYSFRDEWADQWYDLNNSELFKSGEQMIVNFRTEEYSLPVNVQNKEIEYVSLYFVNTVGKVFELNNINLSFISDTGGTASGTATTINRLAGEFSAWNSQLVGTNPIGTWILNLNDSISTDGLSCKDLIENGDIENIIFVLAFKGETMEY